MYTKLFVTQWRLPSKDLFSCWLHRGWIKNSRSCVLCHCLGGRQTLGLVGMSSSQPVRSCSEPLLSSAAAQKLYCTCPTYPAAVQYTGCCHSWLESSWTVVDGQLIDSVKLICPASDRLQLAWVCGMPSWQWKWQLI